MTALFALSVTRLIRFTGAELTARDGTRNR